MVVRILVLLALAGAAALAIVATADARISRNTIGADATLHARGKIARGTVLLECTAGEFVVFSLTFTQDGVSGTGFGVGRCSGEGTLDEHPALVVARRGRFSEGPARACGRAWNIGPTGETREWCRAADVMLSPP